MDTFCKKTHNVRRSCQNEQATNFSRMMKANYHWALLGMLAVCATVSLTFAAPPADKENTSKKCPLSDDFLVTSSKTQSPEKRGPLTAVCHNGKILCLPAGAAHAHIQHGDQSLGPCSTVGNNGPCP